MVVLDTQQVGDTKSALPLNVTSNAASFGDFGVALETELDNCLRQVLPANDHDEEKNCPQIDPAAISPITFTFPVTVPSLTPSLPVGSSAVNAEPESQEGISQTAQRKLAEPLQPRTVQIASAQPIDWLPAARTKQLPGVHEPSTSDQQRIERTQVPAEFQPQIEPEGPAESSAVPLSGTLLTRATTPIPPEFVTRAPALEDKSEAEVTDMATPPVESLPTIDPSVVNEKSASAPAWVLLSEAESKPNASAQADRSAEPPVPGFSAHVEARGSIDQSGKLDAAAGFKNGSSPHQEKEPKSEPNPILSLAFHRVVPDQGPVSSEQLLPTLTAPVLHTQTMPSAAFTFDSEVDSSGRLPEVWTDGDKVAVMSQLVEKAQLMVKEKNSEIVVSLKPEFLGRITLRATVLDQALVTTIVTESPAVKELLQSDLPALQNLLQEAGLNSAKVIVTRETDMNFAGSPSGSFHTDQQYTPSFSNQHQRSPFRWPDDGAWRVFEQRDLPPEIAGSSPALDNRYTSRSIHLIA